MGRWRLFVSAGAAGLLAIGLLGAGGAGTAGGATSVNWPQYLYSPGHSSGNAAATAITPANAASLTLAWKFNPATTGFLSSPVVYNGVIYSARRTDTSTHSARPPARSSGSGSSASCRS